ncbi:MAG: hypothetical protein ACRBN8_13490 [Nannocystales bacterium]
MTTTTALRPPAVPFPRPVSSLSNLEDRHANRVYLVGAAAAVLFLGASIAAIAGWLSAAAYLLSALASSGLLSAVLKFGHDGSPSVRARRRRMASWDRTVPVPPIVSNTATRAANTPHPTEQQVGSVLRPPP